MQTLSAGGSVLDKKEINSLVSVSKVGAVKPAVLQMWLGEIMLERVEVDYSGMTNAMDRQYYQERIAADLCQKFLGAIIRSGLWPVFYVVQQSKTNP